MTHVELLHVFRLVLTELRQAETFTTSPSVIDHLNNARSHIYDAAEKARISLDELIEGS